MCSGAVPRQTSAPAPTQPAKGGKGGHEPSGRRSSSPLSGGASGAWVPAPAAAQERRQMTRQKTFKRRVRERMAKTGESYTAARRMLIAQGDRPETPKFEPPVAEERVVEATGRGWQAWFELLDAWEAASRTHTEIARWLRDEHGVDGWYSQSITVGY